MEVYTVNRKGQNITLFTDLGPVPTTTITSMCPLDIFNFFFFKLSLRVWSMRVFHSVLSNMVLYSSPCSLILAHLTVSSSFSRCFSRAALSWLIQCRMAFKMTVSVIFVRLDISCIGIAHTKKKLCDWGMWVIKKKVTIFVLIGFEMEPPQKKFWVCFLVSTLYFNYSYILRKIVFTVFVSTTTHAPINAYPVMFNMQKRALC